MVQAVADLGLALPLVIPPQSPAVLVKAQIDAMGEYPVPLLLSTMAYAGDQYPPPTTYTTSIIG